MERLKLEYEDAVKEYWRIQETVFHMRSSFQKLEQEFMDGQAGILAGFLQEGRPCPVCGAIEHPRPAVMAQNVPTREEWQEAKADLEEKELWLQEKNSLAAALRGQAEEKQNQVNKSLEAFYGKEMIEIEKEHQPDIVQEIAGLEVERKENQKQQKKYRKQISMLKEKKENLPGQEEQLKELQELMIMSEREISVKEAVLRELEKQNAEMKMTLEFENRHRLQHEIDRRNQQKVQLEKQIEQEKRTYQEVLQNRAALEGEVSALQARLGQSRKGNLQEELDLQKRQLEEKKILQQQGKINKRIQKNSHKVIKLIFQPKLLGSGIIYLKL